MNRAAMLREVRMEAFERVYMNCGGESRWCRGRPRGCSR